MATTCNNENRPIVMMKAFSPPHKEEEEEEVTGFQKDLIVHEDWL
jgi:hypothetical protein